MAAPTVPKPHRVRLVMTLDGVAYTVRPLGRDDLPAGAVRGFTLTRPDRRSGRVIHRVADGLFGPSCSCGDQTYRRAPAGETCKHLAACLACGLL